MESGVGHDRSGPRAQTGGSAFWHDQGMPNRNMLGVRIHRGQGDPSVEEVEFTVDDVSLLDTLGLRGEWVRPLRSLVSPPSDHLLGGPDRWDSEQEESFQDGRVAIAGCGCGEVGCAAVAVRVTVKDDEVIWSDFGVRRGERIIGKVFRFNPRQYRATLDRLR